MSVVNYTELLANMLAHLSKNHAPEYYLNSVKDSEDPRAVLENKLRKALRAKKIEYLQEKYNDSISGSASYITGDHFKRLIKEYGSDQLNKEFLYLISKGGGDKKSPSKAELEEKKVFKLQDRIMTAPDGKQYFLMRQRIGKGSFGDVYKGYPLIQEKGAEYLVYDRLVYDRKYPIAFKFLKSQIGSKSGKSKEKETLLKLAQAESQKFTIYYGKEFVDTGSLELEGDVPDYIESVETMIGVSMMPLKAGESLLHAKKNKTIDESSLARRLQLINEILFSINTMHHHRPGSQDDVAAMMHKDLKLENILAWFRGQQEENKYADELLWAKNENGPAPPIDVSPIDFGLTEVVKADDDPTKKQATANAGTWNYIPIEILRKEGGVKSDIYSLTPIIAVILGVEQPFLEKNKFEVPKDKETAKVKETAKNKALAPYNFTDLLGFCNMSIYPHPLKSFVEAFLKRMSDKEYDNRPDITETMKFFLILNQYVLTAENDFSDTRAEILTVKAANLALLSAGLWQQSYDLNDPLSDAFLVLQHNNGNIDSVPGLLSISQKTPEKGELQGSLDAVTLKERRENVIKSMPAENKKLLYSFLIQKELREKALNNFDCYAQGILLEEMKNNVTEYEEKLKRKNQRSCFFRKKQPKNTKKGKAIGFLKQVLSKDGRENFKNHYQEYKKYRSTFRSKEFQQMLPPHFVKLMDHWYNEVRQSLSHKRKMSKVKLQ